MDKKQPLFILFLARVLLPIYWALGSFAIAQIVTAFLSGAIFFILASLKVKATFSDYWLVWVIPLLISAPVLILGFRGKLPGTQVASSDDHFIKVRFLEIILFLISGPILFFFFFKVDQKFVLGLVTFVWLLLLAKRGRSFLREV